jgi:ferredoxin-NADP reductase/Na+-translocating ferredoxin:NAD+ oxidoreductase RnfD subunit
MDSVRRTFDSILNRFTMYRVLVYGLIALLVVAEVLALFGVIGISPLGLPLSVIILVAVGYAANRGLAWGLRVPYNQESWLITALILACIMPPVNSLQRAAGLALTVAVAMAVKFILTYKGSNIFNPAAAGAVVVGLAGIVPATWWVATPALVPFTGLLALIVLRKTRRFTMFFGFAAVSIVMLLLVGAVMHGQPVGTVLRNAVLSWPLVFMGSIMLTEPASSPGTRYYQLLYAALVGALFASELHWGRVATTPQLSLLVGNVLTVVAAPAQGVLLRLKRITQLTPNTYDIAFELPKGRTLQFVAGQYREWTLPHRHSDGRGNRRTFSIASSPTEPGVHIGTKHYEPSSSYKTALLAAPEGTLLRAAHVGGSFTLPDDQSQPLLMIAGGIGITPFRSMVKYLTDSGQKRDVVLLYFAATDKDFVYQDVFSGGQAVGVRTEYIAGTPDARAVMHDKVPDITHRQVYVSGPNPMVELYVRTARQLGVPRHRIHTDFFAGY